MDLQPRPGCHDQIEELERARGDVVAAPHVYRRSAHGAQSEKRVLRGVEFVGEIVSLERLDIGGEPAAAEFLAPLLVRQPAGPPDVTAMKHVAPRCGSSRCNRTRAL